MQPQEEPARRRSSGDAQTLTVETKGVDFRRIRHVDPRYSVYRWDCGSYPYIKAQPVPAPSSFSGAQPSFPPPGSLGYPVHVSTTRDIYCKGRGDRYGDVVVGSGGGQDFLPHQQHCICPDPHDPRYQPHFRGPEAVSWESTPTGCLCCGQHLAHTHGPHHHPRHVDSVRLYQSVYRKPGPDVVRVYPSTRESIDARQTDAPVQCLSEPTSQGLERDQPLERRCECAGQPMDETISCSPISSSPAAPHTEESESTENRDSRRSNGGPERETDASAESGAVTTDGERADATMNVGSLKTGELKSGKVTDAKFTPTRSTSKVTPLYGLPSWWGDEPEPVVDQARKYNLPALTSVASSSSSSPPTSKKQQTELSDTVPLGLTHTPVSYNCNPPLTIVRSCSLAKTGVPATDSSQHPVIVRADVQGSKPCRSNNDLGYRSITFEKPGLFQGTSKSPPRAKTSENYGCLSTFEVSTYRNSPEDLESRNMPQNLKVSRHYSPPERDRPSAGDGEVRHIQHFVYPDPLLPLQSERDIHVTTCNADWSPLKCKAPTAFIVDLQEIDDASQRRITVKTSLSQFLPPRCERSLQRRLSWMKQKRKRNSAKELGEERAQNENCDDVAASSVQCFKLSQPSSFKDSFEEAVTNDVIADDVSETGTYTIDVSSDGESKAVADARERILATFGITEIEDAEMGKGEWPESINSNFEMNWDKNCPKKDESLKSKADRKPTTLDGIEKVVGDSRNGNTDPVTPVAESYSWSFAEERDAFDKVHTSSKTLVEDNSSGFSEQTKLSLCPPLLSKNDRTTPGDIVLTIYTETAAGCSTSRSVTRPEALEMNIHQDSMNSSRRIRCLHNTVLLAEMDWNSNSPMACETWRTEATVDAGNLLQDSQTLASRSHATTKPRYSGATVCSPLEEFNKAGAFPCSSATSESGRIVLPTDRDYFKIPASSYSEPVSTLDIHVRASDISDTGIHDARMMSQRRSTAASESSGDFLESPKSVIRTSGSITFRDQSSRSDVTLDTKILLCDLGKDTDHRVRGTSHRIVTDPVGQLICGNTLDIISDLDEDGSSVDPLFDQVPVASLGAEVMLKPTAEFVQMQDNRKARISGKTVDENRKVRPILSEKSNQATVTEPESSGVRGVVPDIKPLPLNSGTKSQIASAISDKPVASKQPKIKPPTPKSFPKSPSFPDGQLSSRRCFSDLDVADHNETSPETTSSMAPEGKGASGKGATNSVEHTRMNRTFALRCARREANDGTDASRSDNPQRSARMVKKSSGSKFDDVQRSRSASRSRPGVAGLRSLFESSRSAETSVNLGQRVVRKTQENEKKTQQTNDNSNSSRSFMRDDESNSQKSASAFRPPNATKATKKKNPASDRGRDDVLDGASGMSVKCGPVQSRPLSSSPASQESAANEWTRRKKYNPRQSMQTEASLKKTGKPEGKPLQRSGTAEKTESRQRNKKKLADSSTKTAQSPSSDWTDDEKLQLTPRGRDLPAVCQLSARVKLLSDQVLQALRKRPEFNVNELMLRSPKQNSSDVDPLENPPPEFLYIFHNLEAAERQMTAVFKVLSTYS